MPWVKITTGQPLAGRVRPELALGTVMIIGAVTSAVLTGTGLAKVRLVEVGSRPSWLYGAT